MTKENNNRQSLGNTYLLIILICLSLSGFITFFYLYLTDQRQNEPLRLIPQIHLKLSSYFMEFQKYEAAAPNPSNKRYVEMCKRGKYKWNPGVTAWQNIGFHPPEPKVHFQYWIHAGQTQPKKSSYCNGVIQTQYHFPPGVNSNWFVICARGDLYQQNCKPESAPMWFGMSSSPHYNRVFHKLDNSSWWNKITTIQIVVLFPSILALIIVFVLVVRRKGITKVEEHKDPVIG